MRPIFLSLSLLLVAPAGSVLPLNAAIVLEEGFADFSAAVESGWTVINNSAPANDSPLASDTWGQGDVGQFNAFEGADTNSFAGVAYTAGDPEGATVSVWLISPLIDLANGDTLTFYTRQAGAEFANQLEVRLSLSSATLVEIIGGANALGDFTKLIGTINEGFTSDGYPAVWTDVELAISGLAAPTKGRFAFRYVLPDNSVSGSYIGIDSVTYDSSAVAVVPEPASFAFWLGAAVLGGRCMMRRRASRA